MPVVTPALNFLIDNTYVQMPNRDNNVACLTDSVPPSNFYSDTIPQSIQTDLVTVNFGAGSGGVRTLQSDVVLTAVNQPDNAFYFAIYTRSEPNPDFSNRIEYKLVGYRDITQVQLQSATLVTIKANTTIISIANA